jgi:hypothetical protein
MSKTEGFVDALMATIGLPADACEQRLGDLLPPGFRFIHPDFVAETPAALAEVFSRFSARLDPGTRIERTSPVEEHHGRFRYTWSRVNADEVLAEGADFGRCDDAGDVVEIVVFDETQPRPPPGTQEP